MNIFEIIKQIYNIISIPDVIICLVGLILFAYWFLKTSLGINALNDTVPRRNNMPLYLPFVPLFIWFVLDSIGVSIIESFFSDSKNWQNAFWKTLFFCVVAVVTTITIIFLVRTTFARKLKGFGLNVKTIHKDFFVAFVNLLSIWPLVLAAIRR